LPPNNDIRWWEAPVVPQQESAVVPQQEVATATSFSTHFGTIRQQVTVSVNGTHTDTLRVAWYGTIRLEQTVTFSVIVSGTQRTRVTGQVSVRCSILQVVTQVVYGTC